MEALRRFLRTIANGISLEEASSSLRIDRRSLTSTGILINIIRRNAISENTS
jgi:hypothetical protein